MAPDNRVRHILVTGGSGFIGSALVRRLVSDGHEVRVFDDGSRGDASRLKDVLPMIELVQGDIRDPDAVLAACEGIESVFHLAAVNGTELFYSMPDVVLEVGVKGMMNVLDAAESAGVRELFVASSSEVYHLPPRVPTDETAALVIPDPHNPRFSYSGAKMISELLALNYGRTRYERVVIFRPHNVYGPDMGWEHVIPQLTVRIAELTHTTAGTIDVPIQGTGQETRAFMFIDDTTEALVQLLNCAEPQSIYHLGTEEEVTIERLAHTIAAQLGREIRMQPGELRSGGTPRRCPDTSKLRALGYRSRVSLAAGLARTVPWYADRATMSHSVRASTE